MHHTFHKVSSQDLNQNLKPVIETFLADLVRQREPGHCMRVGNLDSELMVGIATGLAATFGQSAQIHVLTSRERTADSPLFISSSKLIELRNPTADGSQRPPLLVFVPDDLLTSAEDSFAEATFERVDFGDAYARLRQNLLNEMPAELRSRVNECLSTLDGRDWRWADEVSSVRFLLSIKLNDYDPEVVGASLCELGLIPDFSLLEDPSVLANRLVKNLEAAKKLTFSTKSEIGRVLDLEIEAKEIQEKLVTFVRDAGLENPHEWSARIVTEPQYYALSFDKWGSRGAGGFEEKIRVEILTIGLPEIKSDEKDPRLLDLIGQKVLVVGPKGPNNLPVKFRCDPAPEGIGSLDHFRLQIVSRENGPTGATKKKKAWPGTRMDATQSFNKVRAIDWEEGWHFIRIFPYSVDGEILPMVDLQGDPVPLVGDEDGQQRPNESDLFYVVQYEDVDVEIPQRAIQRFDTLQHALIHHSFRAVQEGQASGVSEGAVRVNWLSSELGRDKQELVEFRIPGSGSVNIPITRGLRVLEQKILMEGSKTFRWRMSLNHKDDPCISGEGEDWPNLPGSEIFSDSRHKLFETIRDSDQRRILEITDIGPIKPQILEYSQAYLEVLSQALRRVETSPPDRQKAAVETLETILSIDTVNVVLSDFRGGIRNALLLSPTHPLRMLWLATWHTVAEHWCNHVKDGASEHLAATREAVLEKLRMVNFPAVLTTSEGRMVQAIDNIHPLWSVYATTAETDPRGLLAELCTALNLPEPTVGSFALDGKFLADRIRRYLIQHPYIDTLVLNCFNGGRGKIIADTLIELQKLPDLKDLCYNVRLFVGNPEAPGVGEDLAELISPSSSLTVPEADVFATPTGNHLAPKLTFAVRSNSDFQAGPAEFVAHVTLLFDVFPAQTVSAASAVMTEECSPIHGLLQDYSLTYEEEGDRIAWYRKPRHGTAVSIPESPEFSMLLSRMSGVISAAAAAVATGQAGMNLMPVSVLVLGPEQKALLHQVHEISDWVFTVDKSLGIEFFDHDRRNQRPEYLIDHSPDFSENSGRRVVITSRSQTEIRVLFERVLAEHSLGRYKSRSGALLAELRALSGRLALKMASATTHRAEALGLALAKLFLDYQAAFRDQAVVPLDSHLDLFRALERSVDPVGDEVSLRRTDLGLFDFDAKTMTLTCRLVEVKCYKNAGGSLASLNSLKEAIAKQIDQSERTLRFHFDAGTHGAKDRPDRILKTQELINMLEFYVERAKRLHYLSPVAYEEAKFFLRAMEGGFKMKFTRSALIFDFEKAGREESLEDHGIEFHRIGCDLIGQLLEALPESDSENETIPFGSYGDHLGEQRPDELISIVTELATLGFPRLEKAAFLSPSRLHTVSWERLGATRDFGGDLKDTGSAANTGQPNHDSAIEPDDSHKTVVAVSITGGDVTSAVATQPYEKKEGLPVTAESNNPAEPPAQNTVEKGTGDQTVVPDLAFDVLLGATGQSPQCGVIAKLHGRSIALDLNQTQTISLFGVQGGGKSYTLGSIIEMATMQIPGVNRLPKPLSTIVFHYSETQDYKPEFTSMNRPNDDANAVATLLREYQAKPAALRDLVLLAPEAKVAARREEYPGIEVIPLKFSSSELQASHWRFLMGAIGNQATYIRRLNQLMRGMRDNLTLAGLRHAVENSEFSDSLRDLALMRLDLASGYIDDSVKLSEVIRPGRLVIVDLRDEFIEKDEALGLFVVLLQLFADATYDGVFFNKLVVFDEAHKYIDSQDLVDGLVSVVREMRHKGTSILVASQDPPSVPVSLIELSTQIILHRFNSPAWLKHIQKANAALSGLQAEHLARLKPGEAFIWSAKSTDSAFSNEAVKVQCRPRVTLHGGDTKTAVDKK